MLLKCHNPACLGEGKFWNQTSCKPGEEWAPFGYSCPRHYVSSDARPNQVTGPVRNVNNIKNFGDLGFRIFFTTHHKGKYFMENFQL